jgi:hypothetical protein
MMDKINSITIRAYYYNLETKDFSNLQQAIATNPLIIAEATNGEQQNGRWGNSCWEIKFYDNNGSETKFINIGNWGLSNLDITNYDENMNALYAPVYVYFDIVDPKGLKKKKCFGNGISGVDEAIKYLFKISSYENLENL